MKIVLYTNILTPYRKYFYDLFYQECRDNGDTFLVLVMAENENNRSWYYKDFETNYTRLLSGKTISRVETYIHINNHLKKTLEEINPDVVIASGSYLCPGTWEVANLKNKLNYKLYFWSESHLGEARQYGGFKIAIREYLRTRFYKKFDGFLCPGKLAFNFVEKYSKKDAIKVLLPNLVDESLFTKEDYQVDSLCERLHTNNKIIMFTPARLSEVKGIGPFMELLAQAKNHKEVSLIIAGSGLLADQLKNRAAELAIDAYFIGPKKQEEIACLYKNTDIFVLPSLSDPNPLTCVEALWSKKPLLVSNHVGNYPEVIQQGENGFMFSYAEEENAVCIIEEMISKSEEWRMKAGKKSYEIALSIYDSCAVVKRVRKEICECEE